MHPVKMTREHAVVIVAEVGSYVASDVSQTAGIRIKTITQLTQEVVLRSPGAEQKACPAACREDGTQEEDQAYQVAYPRSPSEEPWVRPLHTGEKGSEYGCDDAFWSE